MISNLHFNEAIFASATTRFNLRWRARSSRRGFFNRELPETNLSSGPDWDSVEAIVSRAVGDGVISFGPLWNWGYFEGCANGMVDSDA